MTRMRRAHGRIAGGVAAALCLLAVAACTPTGGTPGATGGTWSSSTPFSDPVVPGPVVGGVEVVDGFYGPEFSHRFTLYREPGRNDQPLVVFVHGGAWSGGDRDMLPDSVKSMTQDGFAVATIDYRHADVHPAEAKDVVGALAYFATSGLVDGDTPILTGFSAGGHLAALAALGRKDAALQPYPGVQVVRPRALVMMAAPTDLPQFFDHIGYPENGAVRSYIGSACTFPATSSCVPATASPVNFASVDDPPVYLVYSILDERVPLSSGQHTRMATAASTAGVPVRTQVVNSSIVDDGGGPSYHNGTVDEFDRADLLGWLATL